MKNHLKKKKLNQLNQLFKNNNNNNKMKIMDKSLKLESQDYPMMLQKKMLKPISILLPKLNQ